MKQRDFHCARECAVLFQDAARFSVINGNTNKPTPSLSLGYALDCLDDFEKEGGVVLIEVLMSLPPERFSIPASFPCSSRYNATLSGDVLFDRLADLRARLSANRTESTPRPLYMNYVIRYVLRACYALHHPAAFGDAFLAADHADPSAPAAFDPWDLINVLDDKDLPAIPMKEAERMEGWFYNPEEPEEYPSPRYED